MPAEAHLVRPSDAANAIRHGIAAIPKSKGTAQTRRLFAKIVTNWLTERNELSAYGHAAILAADSNDP